MYSPPDAICRQGRVPAGARCGLRPPIGWDTDTSHLHKKLGGQTFLSVLYGDKFNFGRTRMSGLPDKAVVGGLSPDGQIIHAYSDFISWRGQEPFPDRSCLFGFRESALKCRPTKNYKKYWLPSACLATYFRYNSLRTAILPGDFTRAK